jgi:hypothetical protein
MTSQDEFRAGFARAGLAVPTERLDLMIKAYEGYRSLASLLHRPLDHGTEPVGLYVPLPGPGNEDAS